MPNMLTFMLASTPIKYMSAYYCTLPNYMALHKVFADQSFSFW